MVFKIFEFLVKYFIRRYKIESSFYILFEHNFLNWNKKNLKNRQFFIFLKVFENYSFFFKKNLEKNGNFSIFFFIFIEISKKNKKFFVFRQFSAFFLKKNINNRKYIIKYGFKAIDSQKI